ncbi:hypothetical protein GH714_008564 [Hevea brasiliensis]|uniref:histidine kinase n=1 Tax=Hevea brasiliensis TaxID=3981 RepID=A0A6A6LN30_HEVBR|nr:hypothetical protein GH714_008564 [Hevea brasiliensis]
MGGRLTVSSRVNCGSTFTFVLPYKVSPMCDSSDDADDLSDMTDHDAATEDETAGYFLFQPRTLGSLFSSNGSTRTQKLLPHNIGYANSHKLNGLSDNPCSFLSHNVRSKETASVEDAYSTIEVADTLSEPESSFSHSSEPANENVACRSKQCQDYTNSQLQNPTTNSTSHTESRREVDARPKTTESQGSSEAQEKFETSSQCTSGSSPQVPTTKLRPKILLVEDNKINVMVTRSMMKQLGHTIDVVNNGVEAVHAVQCNCYDLILMDVCMPVMDGLQATRLIRSFEETGSWDAAVKAGIELCNFLKFITRYSRFYAF